ncbi:MAG: DUF1592 domain-containing protein [Rubripirellula sp.]|nr:DUF1592 domain-containing protein [Rubripirellula sp.]
MLILSINQPAFSEENTHFATELRPLLQQFCWDCHSAGDAEGGIAFDRYVDSAEVQSDFELWEKVIRLVKERQMPPADAAEIDNESLQRIVNGIEYELSQFDCSVETRPGRVTIQRLNKAEYNNTIRDLTGLELQLANDFPSDDVGNGFDNIGDVLSLPPILLEKYLEAAETIAEAIWSNEEVRNRVFSIKPKSESLEDQVAAATENVRLFATKAFRRPLAEEELQKLFQLMRATWQRDGSDSEIMQTVTIAILSSPNFIFRVEDDSNDRLDQVNEDPITRRLNDYELASRLSYFLWSSMPDDRLFDLASRGELQDPATLVSEAKRMLQDPKANALVDNFAGQWLQLRDVERLTPDPGRFPTYTKDLGIAMRQETEEFFRRVVRHDRSILDFLDADYTYINEPLAKHYGIEGVKGEEFREVSLQGGRRGILTHASILTLTSNPTRTSPVKRGKWILENILDEPPPPPPSDVPELEEGAETLGSLREQMEQHRANPACAVCHRTMDAIGFGLENFDAIGVWRDRDGKEQINASGQLPGNKQFEGASELMAILAQEKKEAFARCLTEKILTYALGRGLVSFDRCVVNDAVSELERNDYRFSALVAAVVTSDAFTKREVIAR